MYTVCLVLGAEGRAGMAATKFEGSSSIQDFDWQVGKGQIHGRGVLMVQKGGVV